MDFECVFIALKLMDKWISMDLVIKIDMDYKNGDWISKWILNNPKLI